MLAFEDRLAALIGERDPQHEEPRGALALQLDYFVARLDRVSFRQDP